MASPFAIYVDIDDVLARTIEAILDVFRHRHGRRVDLAEIVHFDLGPALGLDAAQVDELMHHIHEPQVLEGMRVAEGARGVLARWRAAGHRVAIVTGRPPSSDEPSRRWLAAHRIPHDSLDFVDKYGRGDSRAAGRRALGLEELATRSFALAVEDSPATATFLAVEMGVPVALVDRPWNRRLPDLSAAARKRVHRCETWHQVEVLAATLGIEGVPAESIPR